jgi:hypothetical protein
MTGAFGNKARQRRLEARQRRVENYANIVAPKAIKEKKVSKPATEKLEQARSEGPKTQSRNSDTQKKE